MHSQRVLPVLNFLNCTGIVCVGAACTITNVNTDTVQLSNFDRDSTNLLYCTGWKSGKLEGYCQWKFCTDFASCNYLTCPKCTLIHVVIIYTEPEGKLVLSMFSHMDLKIAGSTGGCMHVASYNNLSPKLLHSTQLAYTLLRGISYTNECHQ